jgi:release factor glutamine methyltransferase
MPLLMTIKEALQEAIAQFTGTGSPRLDAQILLAQLLQVDKTYLTAHDDELLSQEAEAAFGELVARRAAGEPIAYILGRKSFWDLNFVVSPAVLIPRPETEHLIEAALEWAKGKTGLVAADIGTGSGAIAVTVAKHAPNITMHAVDISPDALAVARKNAEIHGASIQFHEGSLASPLLAEKLKVDMLLANLPYIRVDEVPKLIVSDYEPVLALDGGEDGLDLVRELLLQARAICKPNALILLEIGMEQGQAVMDFAPKVLAPKELVVIKDLAGLDRIVKLVMG